MLANRQTDRQTYEYCRHAPLIAILRTPIRGDVKIGQPNKTRLMD